jgi:hypothetical protein
LSNVFEFVANVTGYKNVNATDPPAMNGTESGFLAKSSTGSSDSSIISSSAILTTTTLAFFVSAIASLI